MILISSSTLEEVVVLILASTIVVTFSTTILARETESMISRYNSRILILTLSSYDIFLIGKIKKKNI